jgi:hypothetical protein
MKPDYPARRIVTQTTAREAIEWVRTLHGTLGCAGPPACDDTADAATGKREGELCTACSAREWLERRRLL